MITTVYQPVLVLLRWCLLSTYVHNMVRVKTYLQQPSIDIYEYISQRYTSNSSFCTQQPSGNLSIHFDENKNNYFSFFLFLIQTCVCQVFSLLILLKRGMEKPNFVCSYRLAQEFKWVLIFALFTLLVLLFPRVYTGFFGSAQEAIVCLFTRRAYSGPVNIP